MSRNESNDFFALLDEIQAIARTGLHFAPTWYDRERYQRLLDLAAQHYSEQLDLPAAEIQARFQQEVGCITPKVGADAAIFNERGEILLMDRVDGGGWCLPCGWTELHESPAETVVREVREETGLEVEIHRLVGVFTRPASARFGPHSMVAVVHLCTVLGGEMRLSSEGLALRYWPIEAVQRWHNNHEIYARAAHGMWAAEALLPALSQ